MISNDRLILRDNVLIKNHNPSLNIDRMQTSYVEMDLNSRQISNDKPVTIDGGTIMYKVSVFTPT